MSTKPNDNTASTIFNACKNCRLTSICTPLNLPPITLDELSTQERVIHKGDELFNSKTPFSSIFAVRSGALKTILSSQPSQPQVTGFYLPGDIVGLDGLETNTHTNSATALETTAICEISFDKLEKFSLNDPTTQRPFLQLMSQEINNNQALFMQQSKKNAEQKMASLLLSISARFKKQGYSDESFSLPMPRADIANYLGLTVETVSRVLTKLNKEQYFNIDKKQISQLHIKKIQQLAES